MSKYYLNGVFSVGLLGLLVGSMLLEPKPVAAETPNTSNQKLSETLETTNNVVSDRVTADRSDSVAQTQNDTIAPLASGKASTAELFKADASSPNSTPFSQNRQPDDRTTALTGVESSSSTQPVSRSLPSNLVSQPSSSRPLDSDRIPSQVAPLHAQATEVSQPSNVPPTTPVTAEVPVAGNSADPMGQVTNVSQLSGSQSSDPMEQVTNVSQLRDVQPSDWAYEALRSLVERYGCIAGYPDGTFRGNRAMSRYEFAAGLNACLQQVEKLIASSTSGLATKQDLAALQRLVDEFRPELDALGTRIDKLEGRTAFLEDHQFSTTTRLRGQAIIAAVGAGGGAPEGKDGNIILVNRVRLNLQTSFTGKDTLLVGLQAYNFEGGVFGGNSLQNTLFPGSTLTEGMTKLSFEPQFPGFNPKDLSSVGTNSINLYKLLYIFPVANRLTLFAGTAAEVSDAFPAITPFADEGQEAISRFAGYNPVVRVTGGTSGTGVASAAGFIWSISDNLDLRALYGSANANLSGEAPDVLPGVSGTPLGAGVFRGSSVVAAQLTIKPTKSIDIGLNYANSYHEINILGIGSSRSSADALGGVPLGVPVKLDSVGATVTWRVAPKIALSGYGAYIFVRDSTGDVDAYSNFSSWMVGLHFNDLLKEGNAAGIIFGQPVFRVAAGGDASLRDDPTVRRATPYHLEAYYRFKVSDNISITPGAFILFNPEGNSRNDTTTVGVLRTTFTF